MKRKFLLLTFALTIVFGLSACGKSEENNSKAKDNAKVEKTAKDTNKSKADKVKSTSDNVESKNDDTSNKTTSDTKTASQSAQNNNVNSNSNSNSTDPNVPSTAVSSSKINSNDEAYEFAKQQLGYANNDDIVGGAIKSSENNQPVYLVELKSMSFVVKNGGGGSLGRYLVYPNSTMKEI